MLAKAGQTGAESPELRRMSLRRIWAALIVVLTSCLSVWWILDQRVEKRQLLDPGAFASDRFNRWEFPVDLPASVSFDGDEAPLAFLFAANADSSSFIWFTSVEPKKLPAKFDKERWGGGWLIGTDLKQWEESPGEMAAHWTPRSPGFNTLVRLPSGQIESEHWLENDKGISMSTSWTANSVAPIAPLSSFWIQWFLNLTAKSGDVWRQVHVGAAPMGLSELEHDSLMQLTDGSWLMAKAQDGRVMVAMEMIDSSRSIGLQGQWREGVLLLSSDEDSLAWSQIHWPGNDLTEKNAAIPDADFGSWEQGQLKWGVHVGANRVVWRAQNRGDGINGIEQFAAVPEPVSTPDQQPASIPASNGAIANSRILGSVRNHRTDARMELIWEGSKVVAQDLKGRSIWSLDLETNERPTVWEVDLYRNRKYQTVVFAGNKVHVVDVLGRAVKGFPKRWSNGFSSAAVMDYDRNRQYRFLLAAPNGELFNFRREGERTPGWNFKPRSGRFITSLAHVRVGNKDYVFAGQDDNSVRFLKRSGEDRFDSPLEFPSGQNPVFRLGASLASSTVLFFNASGTLQERTVGSNQPTGMHSLTNGLSVKLEDRTGDGIPEVVVQTKRGEEVWDAGNQRINL